MNLVPHLVAGAVLGFFLPLSAQEPPPPLRTLDLPRWVQEDVINFFNDPSTIQFSGETRIPSSRVIVGNVGSLGGPFTLAGEVQGDLVVVNGDLIFESGGTVRGNVLVVGGRVLGEELGKIGGNLRVYQEPLRYVRRGARIAPAEPRRGSGDPLSRDLPWGEARITVTAGQNYNRVEGLPVMFGPSVRTAGPNPLRLNLFAIWRTETGLELDAEDFGWYLKAEQSVGRRDRLRFGATHFSTVQPIEDWDVSNLEASLATFLLHRDLRDYFEREGWSAFVRFRLPYTPLEIQGEFFREWHAFAPVRGPWSLTKNNDPWREQPLVAEGSLKYLEGTVRLDSRNHPRDPTHGWYLSARLQRGVGGSLAVPPHASSPDPDALPLPAVPYEADFLAGFADLRRYNRVGPGSSLNVRLLLAGALTDAPLPPQRQHALGGEGSLPAYPLFRADCGARQAVRGIDLRREGLLVRHPAFQGYGCDRVVLFQAEFRSRLRVDWGWGGGEGGWEEEPDWLPRVEMSPDWVAFFDLGRGYTVDGRGDSATLVDVGAGLLLGDLGLYYAIPLTRDERGRRPGRFFLRLDRRF